MKKIILSVFLFFFLPDFSSAQQLYFSQATNIPVSDSFSVLQNPWAGGINSPLWSEIDMNGDGLHDLYMYDQSNGRVLTFINDGSPGFNAFHYDPQYASKFPPVYQPGWAKCFDYNCDGKMDFFTLDSVSRKGITLYRNDYTASTGLQFTLVASVLHETTTSVPLDTIYCSANLIPDFIDVDNDGDFDILGFNSNPDGRVAYHKNYAKEHFNRCDTFDFKFESRCWGNFALCIGGKNEVCVFHTSCPPPSLKEIGFGYEEARRDDTISTLFAIDLDGDGDKELLIGDIVNPNSLMVRNGGTPQAADADIQDTVFPAYDQPVNIFDFVFHSYIDVDNDGKKDLIASAGQVNDRNNIWVYKNNGTNAAPVFQYQLNNFLQRSMIDEGEAACPVLFDYDADGLKDLVIGHGIYKSQPPTGVISKLSLYKNTGTPSGPVFQFITDDYAGISTYNLPNPVFPAFGDMDNDGDEDMIIGGEDGKLYYFNNSAGAGNPASFQLTGVYYMNIDVGNAATPQIVDLNNDGLPDLVVGFHSGTLKYFQNTGTASSAFFSNIPTANTLGNVDVKTAASPIKGYAVPYVFKNNNKYQMLVSNMHGDIFYYENIDNNLTGTFTRIDTVLSGTLGIRSLGLNLAVSGGDLNSDSIPEMMVGLFTGGMQIFYGSKTIGIAEVDKENYFVCYPNPAGDEFTVYGLQFTVGQTTIELILLAKKFIAANSKPETGNWKL